LESTPFAALCFTSFVLGILRQRRPLAKPRSCIARGLDKPVQPICSMP